VKWFWKVRLSHPNGQYWYAQVETERVLSDIGVIQDFYEQLTGCKMILEGMKERPFEEYDPLAHAFASLYGVKK
jgi:hypothetical protein